MAKRVIFVLSPGRCGTGYLAYILRCVPGVASFHEPQPRMHEVNEIAQQDFDFARDWWRDVKIPAIERALINHSVYVETSHLFVNAFSKVPAVLGWHIDIITLARSHREVAISYWKRTSIPGKSRGGKEYLIHPGAPHNYIRLPDWRKWTDYQLCYWHCLEVERRVESLVKIYERLNSKIHRTSLDVITTQDGFNQLVIDLELGKPDWRKWRKVKDSIVNPNPPAYDNRYPKENLDKSEQEVECLLV